MLDSPDPEGDVKAIMEAVDNNHSGAIDYTGISLFIEPICLYFHNRVCDCNSK